MISVSKLLINKVEPSDSLRYGKGDHLGETPSSANRPVVVYNCVRRCNLRCVHCYAGATESEDPSLLNTREALAMIRSCADFGCPAMLFSGGEPLLRKDILELIHYAGEQKMRTALSTNGTLITRRLAGELKACGLTYVGLSLDGMEETHDRFRGARGAWRRALEGLDNCKAEGLRVGLRVTLTRHNLAEIPDLLQLFEKKDVPRICFYHLVYTGLGLELMDDDLTHEETRKVMDIIIEKTLEMHENGLNREILTVDNHADGPYLWLWARRNRPELAERIFRMIEANSAKSTAQGICCISWNGDVLPDQFWRDKVLGNIREQSFEAIWMNKDNAFLENLRRRESLVKGRCGRCRYLKLCRGGFRARAEARFHDPWAEDPSCYLT
ncbi:MAG: radical SAM protein, partial [Candidatus Zixiibacteriota bacterium]